MPIEGWQHGALSGLPVVAVVQLLQMQVVADLPVEAGVVGEAQCHLCLRFLLGTDREDEGANPACLQERDSWRLSSFKLQACWTAQAA